jgi:hypothetical protein
MPRRKKRKQIHPPPAKKRKRTHPPPAKKNDSSNQEEEEEQKFMGVSKISKKYRAQIKVDGKTKNLGTMDTAEAAAKAYDVEAIKAGRPASKLNYPENVPNDYVPKKKKLRSTNTIGFRGVVKMGLRYKAQIQVKSKMSHLGMFATPKEAAIAYDRAAIEFGRLKEELNFPNVDHGKRPETEKEKRLKEEATFVIKKGGPLRVAKSKSSSTGFHGVYKVGVRFRAAVYMSGKVRHVGIYATANEAAVAYDIAFQKETIRMERHKAAESAAGGGGGTKSGVVMGGGSTGLGGTAHYVVSASAPLLQHQVSSSSSRSRKGVHLHAI